MSRLFDTITKDNADHEEDLYHLLGCDETSSSEQINCEFRHKIRGVHPDKRRDDDNEAKEKYEKYDNLY